MEKLALLQKMVDESQRIVFSEEREYLQRAIFRIFAAVTVFIRKNMLIRRSRLSATHFFRRNRNYFMSFINQK